MKVFYVKLIFTIVYFIIIIISERIYNEELFNLSVEIIPNFQEFSKSFRRFWVYISYFGIKPVLGPILFVLFLFIPLNKVYSLIFLLLLTGFVDHALKVIYIQERPVWLNVEINPGNNHACGYGNPSGHALTSTCLYLSIWYISCQLFDTKIKKEITRNILKYLLLSVCIVLFLLIMISRVFLGVHSLNQIIYGSSLGFGIFLLFMPTLQMYQSSGTEFLNNKYTKRYQHSLLLILSSIIFYLFFFFQNDIEGIRQKPNFVKMCLKQNKNRILKNASITGGTALFIILGMNVGLYFTKAKIDDEFNEEEIIDWHKWPLSTRLIRLLFFIIGFMPVGVFFMLYYSLKISMIFYCILAPILFFIGGFTTFGLCFFYGYKCTKIKFKDYEIHSLETNDDMKNTEVDYSNEILKN